ncbi:MAG: entericidin A/B family lipoprotein [Luteolibacter sp.]
MKFTTFARSSFTKSRFTRATALSVGGAMLILGMTSCSTARGFGRDVEKTGEKIQDASTRR